MPRRPNWNVIRPTDWEEHARRQDTPGTREWAEQQLRITGHKAASKKRKCVHAFLRARGFEEVW